MPVKRATSSFEKGMCTNHIYTCEESGDFYVKARCYRSLRKSEDPHYLSLILKGDNDKAAVSRAHCSCKGGSGGHCNHVLALLYQLNEYSCLDIPSDVTCTSRPQSWHIARASFIYPLPVMGKEKVARTIYARKMQRQVPGFAIFDAGISVHPKFPYLGATNPRWKSV